MNQNERQSWIWLGAVPGVGAKTLINIRQKLELFNYTLSDFLHEPPQAFERISLKQSQIESLQSFQKEYSVADYNELLESKNIQVICWSDESYPALLREIPDYPSVLYIKGINDLWKALPISVVGTRHLSPYGELATTIITRELVEYGATIISGFMYGADLVAHQTAIHKHGKTVGVLGYGFDYLPENNSQYQTEHFLECGNAFITEFAPFISGRKGNFPLRNRIVAGISHATVVTEAAQKSGSLITANAAAEYGRLVCAVPGPLTSIYSEGTKNLINQGAKLVTSGSEIIEEIFPSLELATPIKKQKKLQRKVFLINKLSATDSDILNMLNGAGLNTDEVATKLKKDISEVISLLSILEVAGAVKRVGDKWWSYL